MTKLNLWNEGDNVLLRGIYDSRPTCAQSMRVVKDTPEETALLIWPGAECVAPSGYIQEGHNGKWNRWQETLSNTLRLEKYSWHTNRFLILLEPEKFYSTLYMWNAASDKFLGYYINFQLPFRRTPLGFDSFDLDLDIVIESSLKWKWKDEDEYQDGIRAGGIRAEWVKGIEHAQREVFTRIEKQSYPLDASWLNWRPDPNWSAPCLPKNWDEVSY
jgi:protein associated with RNAse G/E